MFSVKFYEKLIYQLLARIERKGDHTELYEGLCEKLLRKAGIGCGDLVESSGEMGVFTLLKSLKAPYIVFDVGANVGKYADLVISQLNFVQNSSKTGGGGESSENLTLNSATNLAKNSSKNLNKNSANSTLNSATNSTNLAKNSKQNLSNLSELHCFEPSIFTFEVLKNHILQAYPNLNIKLNNLALSDKKSHATLYYNEKCSGLASLSKRRLDHYNIDFSQSEEIRTTTLDSYCEEMKISHIHLLKMDVEGHEIDVLNGAKGLFERGGIDIATFEFGGCFLDARKSFFQDFWYFFKDYGMQIYRILPSGKLYKIPFYKEFYEQAATTNYVALKPLRCFEHYLK